MASFHLDHLKNYHRRFCRPSRAPNIHTKKGQNMLEILEDCFEEQDSPESLTTSTPKEKVSYSQSADRACQASHSKSVPVSSRSKETFLQVSAEPSEAAGGSVKANEVHQKSLSTDAVSKSTPQSNKMSSKKIKGHHGVSDELHLLVGSPMVLLDAKVLVSPKAVSSAGPKRVTSVSRSSVYMQSSDTDFPSKTKKRLNFEDKVISNTGAIESNALQVEDNTSEGQEGTSSEISQKRDDLSSEVQPQPKKSFSELYLETVKRKSKSRLNFEDKVISNTGAIENNALQVEDNTSEGQEGTSSEISQKRDDLSSEVQPQPKKSFSELYLETVKRKSKSSSVVRHTAAALPPPSPPNDMKLLEDEFIIDGSDRSFSGQPWVAIPRKGRHLSHHMPSPENIAVPQGKKKPGEKLHSLAAMTFIGNTQSDKAHPTEEAQLSVEENLGTTWTNELENDRRSTENKMQSENAKKPSTWKRTMKQKQRRVSKPIVAEELCMGQSKSENRNMSTMHQDKLQINSKRNMEECEEVRNEPIPKKHMPALGSVDGNSSKKNESSVVYPNRKKRTKRNHISENTGKKPFPSKRQKTQISSTVQKSLNVKSSGGTVSSHDNISSSQRKPLKNIEADSAQKNLNISRPKRGSKYQNCVMTSQNVHLKSHTEEYTNKTQMASSLNSEVTKCSVWEESGPSSFNNYKMSGISSSEMGDEKDQKSLDLTRNSNMVPDRNLHHKLVLPSTSPGVRRSKRIRLKPLEYWRGERIDYQERSSGGLMLEIISPTSVSAKIRTRRPGKVSKKVNKKRIHLENYEKNKIELNLGIHLGDPFQATLAKDPEAGEIVPMDLIRPRDTYQFFVEQHGLKVFKTLDTAFFSTGKLILGPYEEKGTQHVGQDILVFYVNFGDLLCTLHGTPYMLSTGDSFYVPSGNHYNIKNLLNMESCLLFTQIKR